MNPSATDPMRRRPRHFVEAVGDRLERRTWRLEVLEKCIQVRSWSVEVEATWLTMSSCPVYRADGTSR